jgi:hypothetical protein
MAEPGESVHASVPSDGSGWHGDGSGSEDEEEEGTSMEMEMGVGAEGCPELCGGVIFAAARGSVEPAGAMLVETVAAAAAVDCRAALVAAATEAADRRPRIRVPTTKFMPCSGGEEGKAKKRRRLMVLAIAVDVD